MRLVLLQCLLHCLKEAQQAWLAGMGDRLQPSLPGSISRCASNAGIALLWPPPAACYCYPGPADITALLFEGGSLGALSSEAWLTDRQPRC